MARRPRTTPVTSQAGPVPSAAAPTEEPIASAARPRVEFGEGQVEAFLYVETDSLTSFSAKVTVIGNEGCCVKLSEERKVSREDATLADSHVVLNLKTLRDDEWQSFVALMRAVFAERERLQPAVALVQEVVTK